MGKASSSKKVARAARASGGRRARGDRNWLFPGVISVVIVLGVMLVVAAKANQDEAGAQTPGTGDHFHMALGVYECDEFSSAVLSDTLGDRYGIHAHTEPPNIVHVHPRPGSTGDDATLGKFFEEVGMEVSDDRFEIPGGETYEEGETECGEDDGVVQLAIWESAADDDPQVITEDITDHRLDTDQALFTLAFAPEDTDLPKPPNADQLGEVTDVIDPSATSTPSSTPGASSTSTPPSTPTTGGASTTAP